MILQGTYKLNYTLDREPMDLTVNVELRQIEGMMKPGQNVWEGHALVNGRAYDKENLSHCVNARLASLRIGEKLKNEMKAKAKIEGQSFRIKKEELK